MNDTPPVAPAPMLSKRAQRKKKETEVELGKKLITEFSILAAQRGCPDDQIFNFLKAGVILQAKQLDMASAARACDYRCPECTSLHDQNLPIKKDCESCGPQYIGVGGPRGGGKSQWMIAQVAVDDCQRFAGLSFLYVRKSAKTLRSQMRKLLQKTCPAGSYKYRESAGEIIFTNGSMITVRHFKDESEIENFLGEEYDGIAYEELTTLSEEKFKNLNSVRRTSKKGWRPRVYASWNWGGIGHKWVKKFFYDPWQRRQEKKTRYILALCEDNQHNDPEYLGILDGYAGWKYQSWRLGNPNLAAGNFFVHFREDVHVYPCDCPMCKSEATFVKQPGVVKCSQCECEFSATTFQDSDAVRWFGSMDYGSSMPNCFHLHAENEAGECFTVGEVHTIDDGIGQNASAFMDLLRLHNLEISDLEFVASGEDVFRGDRKTHDDGSTILTEYRENGILLTPVHVNRVNDFSQMQERIGNPERGIKPTWFIHKSCGNLVSQVQTAQYDPKKPNDVLKQDADKETGEGGSDALESARNGLVLAYNSTLKYAVPARVGSFQPMNQPGETGPEYVDVEEVIRLAEKNEEDRRAGRGEAFSVASGSLWG